MYKKTLILKATYILAVQMLKFIGSFYWLYKALSTHYEYKSTVHVHVKVWYCNYMREYSDAKNYPNPTPRGGQGLQIK